MCISGDGVKLYRLALEVLITTRITVWAVPSGHRLTAPFLFYQTVNSEL